MFLVRVVVGCYIRGNSFLVWFLFKDLVFNLYVLFDLCCDNLVNLVLFVIFENG